jgi:hypothetical protein
MFVCACVRVCVRAFILYIYVQPTNMYLQNIIISSGLLVFNSMDVCKFVRLYTHTHTHTDTHRDIYIYMYKLRERGREGYIYIPLYRQRPL